MILLYILLAFIAYMLWKIYHQKEDEKRQVEDQKFDAEWEQNKREEFKDYPHLLGKVDYSWLDLFGKLYIEKDIPHLKALFLMYLKEANNTKLDMMEVDMLFDSVWDLTEELLEHLEKFHVGNKYEFEIALITYWQIIAQEAEAFIGKDLETIQKMFQTTPFIDIQKIPSWFPKNEKHPDKELVFTDELGKFPRKSEGSKLVHDRLAELGL